MTGSASEAAVVLSCLTRQAMAGRLFFFFWQSSQSVLLRDFWAYVAKKGPFSQQRLHKISARAEHFAERALEGTVGWKGPQSWLNAVRMQA